MIPLVAGIALGAALGTILSLLQIGAETTNELDDLLIFGGLDQEDETVKALYDQFVAPDPLSQRNPDLDAQIKQYVFDDVSDAENITLEQGILENLAERRELSVYRHTGFWQCMDTYREMCLLEEYWQKGNAPWKTW